MLIMNETNQAISRDASAIVPVKRKRGRPRKYPKPDPDQRGNAKVPRVPNLIRGPGLGVANGGHPRPTDAITNNDAMVGQVVNGVIEAAFDAGYLLTVRVGSSETILRGVVFKPGNYVPVSAENDVAPGVQMIRRKEIPFPGGNYNQFQGRNHRSRDRDVTDHAARVTVKAKEPVMTTQSADLGILRGNFVPVVLQPVNMSNGLPATNKTSSVAVEATQSVAPKGKEVQHGVGSHPPNGSMAKKQALSGDVLLASGVHNNTGHFHQSPTGALHQTAVEQMNMPGMPFEKLLTEVIKRSQVPSDFTQNNSSSGTKSTEKDSSQEDDISDTSQALSVEPLQALEPSVHNQPAVESRPLDNFRTGKMTQLLQVLQDNVFEKRMTPEEEPAVDSRLKPDKTRTEADGEGEDRGH